MVWVSRQTTEDTDYRRTRNEHEKHSRQGTDHQFQDFEQLAEMHAACCKSKSNQQNKNGY